MSLLGVDKVGYDVGPASALHELLLRHHFFFDELEPPGTVAPRRLYFRGSRSSVYIIYHLRQTHTFSAHQRPVSRPFSTFPESAARLTDKDCFADATGFGSVNLFSGAEATVILLVYCLLISLEEKGQHTRSCGWRVRWDDLFQHHGIYYTC